MYGDAVAMRLNSVIHKNRRCLFTAQAWSSGGVFEEDEKKVRALALPLGVTSLVLYVALPLVASLCLKTPACLMPHALVLFNEGRLKQKYCLV